MVWAAWRRLGGRIASLPPPPPPPPWRYYLVVAVTMIGSSILVEVYCTKLIEILLCSALQHAQPTASTGTRLLTNYNPGPSCNIYITPPIIPPPHPTPSPNKIIIPFLPPHATHTLHTLTHTKLLKFSHRVGS